MHGSVWIYVYRFFFFLVRHVMRKTKKRIKNKWLKGAKIRSYCTLTPKAWSNHPSIYRFIFFRKFPSGLDVSRASRFCLCSASSFAYLELSSPRVSTSFLLRSSQVFLVVVVRNYIGRRGFHQKKKGQKAAKFLFCHFFFFVPSWKWISDKKRSQSVRSLDRVFASICLHSFHHLSPKRTNEHIKIWDNSILSRQPHDYYYSYCRSCTYIQ